MSHEQVPYACAAALCLALSLGCQDGAAVALPREDRARASAPPVPSAVAPLQVPTETAPKRPTKGLEIAVPAGVLRLGSPTGSVDRNPAREADDVPVEVPAFHIDALPYPNDPGAPFASGASRSEAARLCAADGKRLCSELEWERACKGDENVAYPGMAAFDAARCAGDALGCASPLGVFALGTHGREWTRDDLAEGFGDALRTAVVRGAPSDAEPRAHRCASRDAATPDSKSSTLLFRCCRGEIPSITYPGERTKAPFEDLTDIALGEVLSSMPETRALYEGARLFSGEERTRALAQAGYSRAGVAPWQVAEKPLVWRPVRGEELRVLSFDAPRGAALVAYYPLPDGRNLFAGSYETRGEHGAIILAYKIDTQSEVLFSTCWGCGGEGGALVLGGDGRVHIAQR